MKFSNDYPVFNCFSPEVCECDCSCPNSVSVIRLALVSTAEPATPSCL